MNGKFIVIEGLDGCGKTTQTEILAKRLRDEGKEVFVTREPTDSDAGRLLRKILGGDVKSDTLEMTVLFSADRVIHNLSENGIAERLSRGETVICDRYYYSTFAYQGLDGDIDLCMRLNLDCPGIRTPDVCIFLEMDTDKCLERIHKNRSEDAIEIFENKKNLDGIKARFDEIFDHLPEDERIIRIDADGTIDEVSDRIYQAVCQLWENN